MIIYHDTTSLAEMLQSASVDHDGEFNPEAWAEYLDEHQDGGGDPMTTTDPRTILAEIKARAKDPATVSDLVAVCNDARKAHAALTAVLARHTRDELLLCGAMSEVPHRHGAEREPYPVRPVTCTLEQGHDGDHQDSICCWNFQRFTEAACYKSQEWADRSVCAHCGTLWPCPTVQAITAALGVEG